MRGFLGPGSQIVAYKLLKDRAVDQLRWSATAVSTHVGVSLCSAAISIACVNPVDVIRTRVYNQPFGPDGRGLWYSGGVDAAQQLVKTEGPTAFYKGAGTHFLRLGPHMVLVFMILERLKQAVEGRGV